MKFLSVVTIQALIDGKGVGEVSAGYDGGRAAQGSNQNFITFSDLC